ncbi:transmembrane protein 202-like isoform X2 [Tamandua tetradactyla]|uniref:transmembrane protein 202-like isoform X2 n=1 Tax=Tamandua tetradactyla TaxID=48850 RepID=UPI0040545414
MERREGNATTFHSSYNASILGDPTYRQQLLEQTRSYIRLFCAGFFGFIFIVQLCLSPLSWVQFLVLTDRMKLSAGLWTLCHHEFCWSHTPKPPYYLQFSRAFFLISALTILIITIWLTISLAKGTGDKTYIDLGISIFCFISGTSLLLCLILFLMQVKLYSKNVLEPRFLLAYRLNWWNAIFYMIAGFISGLNHISSQGPPPDQNLLVIPITRTRLGNMVPMELTLNETNVNSYPWMSQVPERQSMRVARPGSQSEPSFQTEAGTQTEPEAETEPESQRRSVTQTVVGIQSKPGNGKETVPRLETETIENVTSDTSSNSPENNEKKMSEDIQSSSGDRHNKL